MKPATTLIHQQFLSGGGEMGMLIRLKDWSQTPLGGVESWPQSLRTTLSIILNSKFPMFLWWGPELICFYNDAYRPSLGINGKHPSILGMPAKEAWPEIWDVIKPLIDQVLAGGEATWSEDQLIPIYRNNKLEDVYWTFSYSPVNDESGSVAGVFVTCSETTQKITTINQLNFSRKKLEESKDQLHFAIEAAELGTWDYNPSTNKFAANDRLKEWFGLPSEAELDIQLALDSIAEKDRQRIADAIQRTMQFSSGGKYESEYSIIHPVTGEERIVRGRGKAWFGQDEIAYRFNGTLQDITTQEIARRKIEESERRFRNVADNAPVLIWTAGTDKRCNFFNKAWLNFTGRTMEEETGNGWAEGVHRDDVQKCIDIYISSSDKQEEFYREYRLKRYDGQYRWISDNGVPRFTTDGVFEGYIGACMDIHERIMQQKKLKENEERLNIVINASELGTWDLNLKTDEIEYSGRLLEIFGGKSDCKKGHTDLLSRLLPEDMPVRNKAFKEAMNTGVLHYESRLIWDDQSIHWIEAKGKVFYDEENKPHQIIGTVRDITNEKTQQQELMESEQKFRLLADSMPQFVWTGDALGNLNYFNRSVYNYSGLTPEQINKEGWIQIVHPDEREANIRQWINAVTTGQDFNFEHRFRRADGEYRWQLSRAIPQRDAAGNIQMWVGTSTDIQDQKTFARKLENEVQERTRQLKQKNRELEKMNSELESFAYVSSHDLQEPLRKIQTFSGRILDMDHKNLSDGGKEYFLRMQNAAKRMQTLIEDLLTYSRTNTTERIFEITNLATIVDQVRADLKEEILQKNATIEVAHLCEAKIIPFQFRQLMHNLLSNSLKFSKPGTVPHIQISGKIDTGEHLDNASLVPHKRYCHIMVCDNGIGFDNQYKDRIFEVFQRLHGKEEYKGTGIGLAIVKKIVENHDGVITATGQVNKGAQFDIYIPAS